MHPYVPSALRSNTIVVQLKGTTMNQPSNRFRQTSELNATSEDYLHSFGASCKGQVLKTAAALRGLGITKQDTVMVALPDIPQAYIARWAVEAVGTLETMNLNWAPGIMFAAMYTAQPKALITLGPHVGFSCWDRIESVVGQVETLDTILQVDLTNDLGPIRKLPAKLLTHLLVRRNRVRLPQEIFDFERAVEQFSTSPHTSDASDFSFASSEYMSLFA